MPSRFGVFHACSHGELTWADQKSYGSSSPFTRAFASTMRKTDPAVKLKEVIRRVKKLTKMLASQQHPEFAAKNTADKKYLRDLDVSLNSGVLGDWPKDVRRMLFVNDGRQINFPFFSADSDDLAYLSFEVGCSMTTILDGLRRAGLR